MCSKVVYGICNAECLREKDPWDIREKIVHLLLKKPFNVNELVKNPRI